MTSNPTSGSPDKGQGGPSSTDQASPMSDNHARAQARESGPDQGTVLDAASYSAGKASLLRHDRPTRDAMTRWLGGEMVRQLGLTCAEAKEGDLFTFDFVIDALLQLDRQARSPVRLLPTPPGDRVRARPAPVSNVQPVSVAAMNNPAVIEGLLAAAGVIYATNAPAAVPHRQEGVADLRAFRLTTGDPFFDPAKPVCVNGFLYLPAKEA